MCIRDRLASTKTRVDRVGAMGAAMASLKPYYVDGTEKGQIMAGVGLYHGEKALALGYGYAPNDKSVSYTHLSMELLWVIK